MKYAKEIILTISVIAQLFFLRIILVDVYNDLFLYKGKYILLQMITLVMIMWVIFTIDIWIKAVKANK